MYLLLSLNFLELLKTILTFQLLLVFKPWSKQITHYTGSTSMQLRTVWLCPQEIASLKKAWMNYVWRRFYQQQRCKKKPLWTLYTLYRELYVDTFLPIPFFRSPSCTIYHIHSRKRWHRGQKRYTVQNFLLKSYFFKTCLYANNKKGREMEENK